MDAVLAAVKDFQVSVGEAYPLGATLVDHGCNFAIYAPDAKGLFCAFSIETRKNFGQKLFCLKKAVTYGTALLLI